MNILLIASMVAQNNLHTDGTKLNTHVHRNWDMLIYRVRKDEHATLSEVVQDNLPPNGTKLMETPMYIEIGTH